MSKDTWTSLGIIAGLYGLTVLLQKPVLLAFVALVATGAFLVWRQL